ncbi:hypothetical protein EC991_003431 [Linnemannia zychae]|nr:hypothetical protein EC991_003431 [Linnemannia zychae]
MALPTPEVSPEELSSDSSDDMVIVEGDLLEESKSVLGLDYYMRSTGQLRQQTYPGAVAKRTTTAVGATIPADLQTLGDGASIDGGLDAVTGTWSWLTDSPFLDALVNWIEGPDIATQQRGQEKDNKPNPWLDIPFQFIALLTYPEPDPKNGNKMTLALVRETSFVKQRRKTLMMLTAYTLVVRYCSLDFFILVLFASNCAMLFLMKNSGRMNVNMAKRAVRQRVGWAKQWAGSIFKRGGNNSNNNNSNNAGSQGHGHSPSGRGHHRTHSSSMSNFSNSNLLNAPQQYSSSAAHSARSSPALLDNTATSTPIVSAETSPQMKRRGLFGKRVPVNTNASNTLQSSSSAYTQGTALSSASAPLLSGDMASMPNSSAATVVATTTTTTPKRRFFRRNQNGSNASTTTITSTTTPSAPVLIPTKANTISHHPSSHSTTPPPGTGMSSSQAALISPTRSATAMAVSASSTTTNTMYIPQQQQQQQLSTSPLAQSQSLPQLQFSPLKPFNLNMLTNDDTEMEQVDARWATRSRPLAMSTTPPPMGRLIEGSSSTTAYSAAAASGATGSTQQQATTVPSSSSSSTTSSPKAGCTTSEGGELLSPIPIPIPISTASANTQGAGASGPKQQQQQGPQMLSGLSQLLGRSSSASPPLAPSVTGDDSVKSTLNGVKGEVHDRYGDMLPTTTTTTSTTAITADTLDAVTSAAAAAMEGV